MNGASVTYRDLVGAYRQIGSWRREIGVIKVHCFASAALCLLSVVNRGVGGDGCLASQSVGGSGNL